MYTTVVCVVVVVASFWCNHLKCSNNIEFKNLFFFFYIIFKGWSLILKGEHYFDCFYHLTLLHNLELDPHHLED